MSGVLHMEDRCIEIDNLADTLHSAMVGRMTLDKNLKKKRWRSKGVSLGQMATGMEEKVSEALYQMDWGSDPEKVWKAVGDAAAYMAMAAEKYQMKYNDIEEIPLKSS